MIDWNNISTVFLDMDGTLLDLHFDNHFWLEHVPMRYAQENGLTVEQAKQSLFPKMHALRGQLDWYCTDFWSKELNLPIIELKREVSNLIKPRPQVAQFLNALRAADKHIILFTNAHQNTVALKMQKTKLQASFDKIITSHFLGHAKEAMGVWEALHQHHPFKPSEALFVDDSFSVLDNAQAYGIGWLLGIAQPDSKGGVLHHKNYNLLDSFEQIMP